MYVLLIQRPPTGDVRFEVRHSAARHSAFMQHEGRPEVASPAYPSTSSLSEARRHQPVACGSQSLHVTLIYHLPMPDARLIIRLGMSGCTTGINCVISESYIDRHSDMHLALSVAI